MLLLPDMENRVTFIGDLDKTPFRNVFFQSSGADKQMEGTGNPSGRVGGVW